MLGFCRRSSSRRVASARSILLVLLLGRGPVAVADDPPAGSVPSDPVFQGLLVDGSVVAGRIIQVDAARGVTLADEAGRERTIDADRLVKLTRDASPTPPPAAEGEVVLLPRGDRLARCAIRAASDTALDVQPVALGKLAIPLDAMVGLILVTNREGDAGETLEDRIRSEPRAAEQLWLANGDRLDGLFAGLTETQVAFQPPSGRITLPRSGVTAIGFDPARVVESAVAGPSFEWLLLDGTRLGLATSRLDRGIVVGRPRFGGEVRFPIGEVARVRVLGASVDYLSDREAAKVGYESYLGPTRPYRRERNVAGAAIRLGGRTFDRGLGTQSRTLLAYRLDPRAKRFQATVGLDDAAGPLGNVVFKVLVDGKPRYESPRMGAGEPPRAVDVDVAGAKILILVTEFGERGDVQDSGDWAEARIIR